MIAFATEYNTTIPVKINTPVNKVPGIAKSKSGFISVDLLNKIQN